MQLEDRQWAVVYMQVLMDTVWTLRSYKRWAFLDEVCNYQLVKTEAGFGLPCRRRECVLKKLRISLTNFNQY